MRYCCNLSLLLCIIYMNKMRQKWRVTRYGNISIRVSFKNEPLSFALNHILLAKCEDDLQYSV